MLGEGRAGHSRIPALPSAPLQAVAPGKVEYSIALRA